MIRKAFSVGIYKGVAEYLKEDVYGIPFEIKAVNDSNRREVARLKTFEGEKLSNAPYKGGVVLAIDLGGSDVKVIVLADGEVVYKKKHNWEAEDITDNERSHVDLCEDFAREALRATEKVRGGRLDYLGVSSKGAVVNNEIRSRSIGKSLSEEGLNKVIRPFGRELGKRLGIPYVVVNDGDAGALWAALKLGVRNVLAISLGTSVGGGYVDKDGRIGTLSENAKFILDMNEKAELQNSIGVRGTAKFYTSQTGVFNLAKKLFEEQERIQAQEIKSKAERLEYIQGLYTQGYPPAKELFRQVAGYFAALLTQFHKQYGMDYVVLFGRVVSGESGDYLLTELDSILSESDEGEVPFKIEVPAGGDEMRQFAQGIGVGYFAGQKYLLEVAEKGKDGGIIKGFAPLGRLEMRYSDLKMSGGMEVRMDLGKGRGKRFEDSTQKWESRTLAMLLNASLDALEDLVRTSNEEALQRYLRELLERVDNRAPPVVVEVSHNLQLNSIRVFDEDKNQVKIIFSERFIGPLLGHYALGEVAVVYLVMERLYHELGHYNGTGLPDGLAQEEARVVQKDIMLHKVMKDFKKQDEIKAYLSRKQITFHTGNYFDLLDKWEGLENNEEEQYKSIFKHVRGV
jgi:predicted NBD/HSP70 family sugar kinase